MRIPTVCRAYFDGALKFLSKQGIGEAQLKAVLKWNPTLQITDGNRFPLRYFEHVLEAGALLLNDACFGARVGFYVGQHASALMDYLFMSAADGSEALAIIAEFSPLLVDHGYFDIEERQGVVTFTWRTGATVPTSRQLTEFHFASWCGIRRRIFPDSVVRMMQFPHPKPDVGPELDELFAIPLIYNSPVAALQIDLRQARVTGVHPDPDVHVALLERVRQELNQLQREDRLISRVSERIDDHLQIGLVTLETVAAELDMSARTLQRRLNDVGTSFKALVDDVRKAAMQRMLRDSSKSLFDVSEELGFSNQSAFHRAVKRWYGQSPGLYREQLRARMC